MSNGHGESGPAAAPGAAGPGAPVIVATFRAVHEAEVARLHLASEGISAEVWDANLVSADPLLSVAIRGVKLVTREPDAARARALLDPVLAELEGPKGPVFRVVGTRAGTGLFYGSVIGLMGGFALGRVFGSAAMVAAAVGGGALIGVALGMKRRADACSEPSCGATLPLEATHCPKCGGELRGSIAHANQRLAAEEALPDYAPVDSAGDEHDEDKDDGDPEDGVR